MTNAHKLGYFIVPGLTSGTLHILSLPSLALETKRRYTYEVYSQENYTGLQHPVSPLPSPCCLRIFSRGQLSFVCQFFFSGWLTLLCVAILLPLQYLLIPQILAAVLICLYLYRILRDRALYPIRREIPVFLTLSFWTILSAVCILLGCMALGEGSGAPRG